VYFTLKAVHKHIVVKVLYSVDCYLNMTLYNTATITYSTAHHVGYILEYSYFARTHECLKKSAYNIYRSSVLEQTFLCPTPHYVY
jgi:hypothetical protein